jgi:hypothetical protein
LKIWRKKGNNSKMGNGIYFKIAGYVDLAVLIIFTPCQISVFINGFWVITQKLQFYPHVLFRHGGHDGWSAGSSDISFKGNPPLRMIQAQWFQRRRFLKKFTDGHQVMAIAHMTLWVRWAKNWPCDCATIYPLNYYFCWYLCNVLTGHIWGSIV